ncbi:hypothetical protein [Helicobacter himalayensis]|uniref:HP0838 family lipoprotein n=1 Tax=Helicobacter himalayensis TaxID=1591088 RepID=UPI000B1A9243|nr:hypothetical protein [Helicobacter himalayensis]
MRKHFFYSIIPLIFFLSSCADVLDKLSATLGVNNESVEQEEEIIQPTKFKILQVQSPQFSFYDFTTILYKKKQTEITLYTLGKPVGKITIKEKEICFNNDCAGKWRAAKNFFGAVSYGDLFEDILFMRDIFEGEGKRIEKNNTTIQWFVKNEQEIYYERTQDYTLFRNLSTGVSLGIQDYKVKVKKGE